MAVILPTGEFQNKNLNYLTDLDPLKNYQLEIFPVENGSFQMEWIHKWFDTFLFPLHGYGRRRNPFDSNHAWINTNRIFAKY